MDGSWGAKKCIGTITGSYSMTNRNMNNESGFTLIELMVTMLISLIILAGVTYSFINQNSEYAYQNKRVNVAEDLQFTLRFMANGIQKSLVSQGADPTANVTIIPGPAGSPSISAVSFKVWNPTAVGNHRERRCYLYRTNQIYINRNFAGACNAATLIAGFDPMVDNITVFRVIQDTGARPLCPNGNGFQNIPSNLPVTTRNISGGTQVSTSGFSILIESGINAGYKKGSFTDVCGIDTRTTPDTRKRIWRYAQIYPGSAVL